MKTFVAFAALVLAVSAVSDLNMVQNWISFKATHGKIYENELEEAKRFAIFQDNVAKIETHNALYKQGATTYTLKLNQFGDMTQGEFGSMFRKPYKTGDRNVTKSSYKAPESVAFPASYDWREQNVVNAIKDQGKCDSSWAFSSIAIVESAYAIKTGQLLSLSEQQLIDCARGGSYVSEGCNGGNYKDGLGYIADNGVELESEYSYNGATQSCSAKGFPSVSISSYFNISPEANEDLMAQFVATRGPIGVSLFSDTLQFYHSGVFTGFCVDGMLFDDYSVTIVGYGSENGVDYWIIRNSWGTSWGESGYLRLQRGVNKCYVGIQIAYVQID